MINGGCDQARVGRSGRRPVMRRTWAVAASRATPVKQPGGHEMAVPDRVCRSATAPGSAPKQGGYRRQGALPLHDHPMRSMLQNGWQ